MLRPSKRPVHFMNFSCRFLDTLIRVFAAQDFNEGHEENLDVERQAPIINVSISRLMRRSTSLTVRFVRGSRALAPTQ